MLKQVCKAPKGILNVFLGIKSRIEFETDLVISGKRNKISFDNIHDTPTIYDERPPNKEELAKILYKASVW
ncbi:MAG: hypothetical protein V3T40_07295 [Nitrososphaerales archaeon]